MYALMYTLYQMQGFEEGEVGVGSGSAEVTARVAVIGAGYFAAFHHDAWRRLPRAQLVGVMDREIEKARATGAPAFADAAQMLRETRPDIVDIATPPDTHLDLIRLALAHEARAIICQKPFCGSLAQAREASAAAEAGGIPLIVH